MASGLTVKERRFVEAYLGPAHGNGAAAAIAAGYSRVSAKVTACRLLTKANLRATIDERLAAETQDAVATAEEIDALVSAILRDRALHELVRLKAAAELNKVKGRHSLSVKHSGEMTLAQMLADSRDPTR